MNEQQKKNVLIIEHEAIIALDIKRKFQMEGFNVLGMTTSLHDTIERIKNIEDIDLILVDSNLDDFYSSFHLAKKLSNSFKTPIILLSCYLSDEIIGLSNECNNIKILKKPFDNNEFHEVIGSLTKNLN